MSLHLLYLQGKRHFRLNQCKKEHNLNHTNTVNTKLFKSNHQQSIQVKEFKTVIE